MKSLNSEKFKRALKAFDVGVVFGLAFAMSIIFIGAYITGANRIVIVTDKWGEQFPEFILGVYFMIMFPRLLYKLMRECIRGK